MLAKACDMGLEGIVSKRADAPYTVGRAKDWLKAKCQQRAGIHHHRLQ
jgi:bifunctional non-homologous end joining protein LigD